MSEFKSYMKRNKFNAKKTSYNGRIYHSVLECNYAIELDWRKKAGEIKEIIPQYRFDLRINGIHWRYYKIDFKIELKDGTFEYVEIKGFPTNEWKQKWDVTVIIFDELTKGENAKLYLNSKLIKQNENNKRL